MKKKKVKKLKYRYSGKYSSDFWDTVNSLKDESDRREAYALGVALQNLEGQVLQSLLHASRGSVEPCAQKC